jgi:hypothetical protein
MFYFEEIGARTVGHGAHFLRRKHWTGVTKALALQISNETSPPVKTLISISHRVVPSVSFPTSPTVEGSESPRLCYDRCTERTLLL